MQVVEDEQRALPACGRLKDRGDSVKEREALRLGVPAGGLPERLELG
jgi:hypothetical protein